MKRSTFYGILIAAIISAAYIISTISIDPAYGAGSVKIQDTTGTPRGLKIAEDGSQDVNIQDQTTRPLSFRLNMVTETGITLASSPVVNSYTAVLTAGHAVAADERVVFLETADDGTNHIYSGAVLNVATNTLTLDTPIPFAFTAAATVYTGDIDMTVDGSSTVKVFSLTNAFATPADITRFIFHITDDAAMDDAKFGGLNALTRGIVLRKKLNGTYINFWNVKTNGGFGELAYDKTYDDKAPAGVYGLSCRLTYGGQSKHGVVIRLEPNEEIQLLIQDNLTGLVTFTTTVQGHFTTD